MLDARRVVIFIPSGILRDKVNGSENNLVKTPVGHCRMEICCFCLFRNISPYTARKLYRDHKKGVNRCRALVCGIGSDQDNIKISRDKPLLNGPFWFLKATFQEPKQHSIQKMHWIIR